MNSISIQYIGIRERLYQISLAPIWNNFWWWWPIILEDGWDLSFPDICLTFEENPRKNPNQENWPDRGQNPGPTLARDHSGGQVKNKIKYHSALILIIIIIIIIREICPRAGYSLQAQEPRLQFWRRLVFHRKLRNQGCSFTRDSIGAVASCCFPHSTLSLASKQILKDLRRFQGHQRGGKESGFG